MKPFKVLPEEAGGTIVEVGTGCLCPSKCSHVSQTCPLMVEETFLTARWYEVVSESCDRPTGTKLRQDIKPQVDSKNLRMWFFSTSLSTPGN